MDITIAANQYLIWNSRGVADLELGRHESAVDTFRTALSEMRSRLNDCKEGAGGVGPSLLSAGHCDGPQTQTSADTKETEKSDMMMVVVDSDSDSDSAQDELLPALESVPVQPLTWESPRNLFDFYPRAFNLAESSENAADYTRPLVVLLYNLALTHHTRSDSPSSLVQAVRLYQSAMNIMSNSWNKDDFEEMQCLLLAVANNLGHLQSHLMNFQETRECLNLVMNMISYPSDEFQVSEEDYTLFYNSVCAFLDAPELCLAPAA